MGELSTSFVTLTCDGTGCDKTVTFEKNQEGVQRAIQDNPWMHTLRHVQTQDSRVFVYCGDECEKKAIGLGLHNKQVLITPQGPDATKLAAQAADRARLATQALKSGAPVTLS